MLQTQTEGALHDKQLWLEAYIYQYGPRPVQERRGFHTTIELLSASQKKGQNDPRYVQF